MSTDLYYTIKCIMESAAANQTSAQPTANTTTSHETKIIEKPSANRAKVDKDRLDSMTNKFRTNITTAIKK